MLLKRVYEPAAGSDGARFLVERLWPRGISKETARLDAWLKDAAGRHAYVMTEMAATVVVFDWDPVAGRLVSKQEIAVLESRSPGPRHGTDVLLDPDGVHAYATNRGEDCIAVFRVDAGSGRLASVGRVALPGRTPRHTVFTPAGDVLLVAGQDSYEILSFRRQPGSGGLKLVARSAVPSPACILFAPEGC